MSEEIEGKIEEQLEASKLDIDAFMKKHSNVAKEEEDDQLASQGGENIKSCKKLNADLCGSLVFSHPDEARTEFLANMDMVMDDSGMVHTGILESASHFCALSFVNEKNAIISQCKSEYLSPVGVDMKITFTATPSSLKLSRRIVKVKGKYKNVTVFESIISVLVMDRHIMDGMD